MRATKPQRQTVKPCSGPAWGAWIKLNVVRDLRSGVLRVNAEGATIH